MNWADLNTKSMSRTLLVIPHYNDTKRLEPFLQGLVECLPPYFSILISDDGSHPAEREGLSELIRRSISENNGNRPLVLQPIFIDKNTGKGGAVRRGWDQSTNGEYSIVAFVDADGSVSAGEIMRSEKYLRDNIESLDALFGSRIKMLGKSLKRSVKRHISGRVFATLVSVIGKVPAYDTQCGLKILKRDTFQSIRPDLETDGFAFDVEVCLLLLKQGYKLEEFPISWHDTPGSKVSLIYDSIRMGVEVFRISKRIRTTPKIDDSK